MISQLKDIQIYKILIIKQHCIYQYYIPETWLLL